MITSLLLTALSFEMAPRYAPAPVAGAPTVSRRVRDWDYDGKRILGHRGYEVVVWDAKTGNPVREFKGHGERIHFVALSPDGKHAVSSAWIRSDPGGRPPKEVSTRLWSLESGEEAKRLNGVVATDLSPDGLSVAGFWRRDSDLDYEPVVASLAHQGAVTELSGLGTVRPAFGDARFVEGGKTVGVRSAGAFGLFDSQTGRPVGKSGRNSAPLQLLNPGGVIAVGSDSAEILDVRQAKVTKRIAIDPAANGTLGATAGDLLVLANRSGKIRTWSLSSGKVLREQSIEGRPISVLLSPDRAYTAVEHSPGDEMPPVNLTLYRTGSGEKIATFALPEWGRVIGFSRDGKTLLVGGSSFWIVESGTGKVTNRWNLLGDQVDSYQWADH